MSKFVSKENLERVWSKIKTPVNFAQEEYNKSKNLVDFSRYYSIENLVDNKNGTFKANINNDYFGVLRFNYLEFKNLLLNNLGETFTFSVSNNYNKYIAVIIFGTRTSGSSYQEENKANSNSVSITIANDFTSIDYVEFRVLRSMSPYTNTSSVVGNLQFEFGNTATSFQQYNGEIVHKGDIIRKVIWQNADASSGMGAGSVAYLSDALSKYNDRFFVEYLYYANIPAAIYVQEFKLEGAAWADYVTLSAKKSSYTFRRNIYKQADTQLYFEGGYIDDVIEANACIPYRIYVAKEV